MTYIDLINAFEKWLETNYLQSSAQLLWYKLISLFNRAGWGEWVTVDNYRLMSMMQITSEKTLIRCRDKLIENNFFEFQKGKKGSPNKYKICTVNFTAQKTVQTTVKKTVQTTANVSNINRIRQDKDKDKISIDDVVAIYENNIATATVISREILINYCQELSPELVKEAIRKAVLANKTSMKYIQAILNSWKEKGLKTMNDVKNEEIDFEKNKNKKTGQNKELKQRDYSNYDFNKLYANTGGENK